MTRLPHTLRIAAAAGLVALIPASGAAQAMRVGDLGTMPSRTGCLETAGEVLTAYISEFGGHATSGDPEAVEAWAIYGWGLRPGINDVVITCPTLGNQANAFFTVHATGAEAASNADTVADRLRTLWERLY